MTQLLCHLWGDYILQSDWMAQNKTKNWFPALIHAMIYTGCFAFLLGRTKTVWAGCVICGSHFLIDRFRLARYVVWAKNWMGPWKTEWIGEIAEFHTVPPNWTWKECQATGYPPDCPTWLAVWLLIIADNTLHLTINYLALRFL